MNEEGRMKNEENKNEVTRISRIGAEGKDPCRGRGNEWANEDGGSRVEDGEILIKKIEIAEFGAKPSFSLLFTAYR